MNLPTQLFVDGSWKDASDGRRTKLTNPATGQAFIEVASASKQDANQAIDAAHRAWKEKWRDLAPGKRTDILFNIARILREHLEEIAQAEMLNIGKPISDARDEAGLGARVFEYYAGAVGKFYGETIPVARGGFDFTLKQSMGVVSAIVPWNFPFPIACWKVAPALAAGNTVILKPATLSPLSALLLGRFAHEAGLPAGALQVLPGSGGELGELLVQHPLVRKVSFTGSTEVGRKIMQQASAGLKRISLELGGKSPNIIFADADLEAAAAQSPMSVFANTGQDCCARSRIFVEKKVMDQFLEKFTEATRGLKVGSPADEATQLGPLVSDQQRASVEDYIASAREAKRSIVAGGDRPSTAGAFLNPTVITDVERPDRVWREEIFGPVVCIRPFEDEAAMLEEVNDTPYGLSGSLWTNDLKRALRVARRVESGVLSINSHSSVHVEAPFGGYKESGIGRDLGMRAMDGYTELKNVYVAE